MALERIQAGATSAEAAAEDDSPKPNSPPPQDKIALTFSSACQTDEQLLEFRDVADEVIIDRLSKRLPKRVKANDGKAAPPGPTTKPRSSPKPPVAEVTVARAGATGGSPASSKGSASPSPARPSQAPATFDAAHTSTGNRHPYGLAPRYSSYRHHDRGHFSYHHHMSPPHARVSRPETNNNGSADGRRSLFDVAAHHRPTTPKTSANTSSRQINNEEYERIQRNESARHLIRLLS